MAYYALFSGLHANKIFNDKEDLNYLCISKYRI